MPAILITQSLQNDFVKPIGRYDPIPCMLHIGYSESKRLMGDNPEEGPIGRVMRWAYALSPEELIIIHIRDWHDTQDSLQDAHLDHFGTHCLKDTEGAEFAFHIPSEYANRQVITVNSVNLSDFIGTDLAEQLREYSKKPIRVGLVGVWTDANLYFLVYELKSRFPNFQIAVCSALTASTSKTQHYLALEQLERLFGIKVFSSIGEFTNYLNGSKVDMDLPRDVAGSGYPKIDLVGDSIGISQIDQMIIKYLFRDSQSVRLKVLTGGFSGNLVLYSESTDMYGHSEVPHVIKIGDQEEIGKERASFERIEGVMGNEAPSISDFIDYKGRGAIKYRYAAMGGGFSNTFQKLYMSGMGKRDVERILKVVINDQLGKFYKVAKKEDVNLLEYYNIAPAYAKRMKQKVEDVLGHEIDSSTLRLPTGHEFPNIYAFYSQELEKLHPKARGSSYFSYVHGDLNGANIIIDEHGNVWLIDFFWAHYGHALKDIIKLENDLMYIWTPVEGEEDLREAVKVTDAILRVRDLGEPLPPVETTNIAKSQFVRAYDTIRFLRSLYPSIVQDDRNTLQLLIGQLWYSGRTLTYPESNRWQKLWALYTVGNVSKALEKRLKANGPLRIGWLSDRIIGPGKMGITILPGRKDRGRSLAEDIKTIKEEGVTHALTLLTSNEFENHGVEDLFEQYEKAGITIKHFPILDHSVPSVSDIDHVNEWIDEVVGSGGTLMIHCLGGLGRSGVISASYLMYKGLSLQDAIGVVRQARSSKAIENKYQEDFLRRYAAYRSTSSGADRATSFHTFDDVIDFALSEEKGAVDFYTQLAEMVKDPSVKELLISFAREENGHYNSLINLKKKCSTTGVNKVSLQELKNMGSMVETDDETVPLVKIGPDMSYQDALELATFKEKSAFRLYLKMAEAVKEKGISTILLSLAKDEAKHKAHFELLYEKARI